MQIQNCFTHRNDYTILRYQQHTVWTTIAQCQLNKMGQTSITQLQGGLKIKPLQFCPILSLFQIQTEFVDDRYIVYYNVQLCLCFSTVKYFMLSNN